MRCCPIEYIFSTALTILSFFSFYRFAVVTEQTIILEHFFYISLYDHFFCGYSTIFQIRVIKTHNAIVVMLEILTQCLKCRKMTGIKSEVRPKKRQTWSSDSRPCNLLNSFNTNRFVRFYNEFISTSSATGNHMWCQSTEIQWLALHISFGSNFAECIEKAIFLPLILSSMQDKTLAHNF